MKVYLSIDAEGIAGISDWDQIRTTGDDFALGRRLMLGELNAAIDGVLQIDPLATIVVNDSHGTMRNFPPDELHGKARLIAGRNKPMYMMEGLDDTFDAILFIGYHGSVGASRAILSHTYNPRAVWEARINGRAVGESAINGLVAAHYRVPIALISGDDATAEEARAFIPGVETVVVKSSVSRSAADSLHPAEACDRVQSGVRRALMNPSLRMLVPLYQAPTTLEVTFLTADMAEASTIIRSVERVAGQPRAVAITHASPLAIYQSFVGLILLTRALVE
jgi:D-amino peptidase